MEINSDKFKPLDNRVNIVITTSHYNEFNGFVDNLIVFKTFVECYNFLNEKNNRFLVKNLSVVLNFTIMYLPNIIL